MTHDKNMALLQERVERNYKEYKEEICELDSEGVFETAAVIALHTEIYEKITRGDFYMTKETVKFLLQFENPLKIFVGEWDNYYKDSIIRDIDFAYFLDGIMESVDGDDYMTVSETERLCDKHNTDNILDAVISEITELSAKYFGRGVEFWGKP